MNFTARQDFTSLTELLRLYGDADEIIFQSHCQLDESQIAETCRHARRLAQQLRWRHPAKSAAEIAAAYGCSVLREAWLDETGRSGSLAVCCLRQQAGETVIRINTDAITSLARLMAVWAIEGDREWFSEAKISEVVIAHELFHLIEQHPPSTAGELGAHAFARAFTRLPFSPLLYQVLLARLGKGKHPGAAEPLRRG